MVQEPAAHSGVALGKLQRMPQAPQAAGSLSRLTSHPFIAFMSQSANPRTQPALPHAPLAQAGTVLFFGAHLTPQPPQWARSFFVSMQAPPQQAPWLQAALQPPQCTSDAAVSTQA